MMTKFDIKFKWNQTKKDEIREKIIYKRLKKKEE